MLDDHELAGSSVYHRRQIWDSKDTVPRELAFLQPLNASHDQVARIMVSPRRGFSVSDGAGQSAAASSAGLITFTCEGITVGTWIAPPSGAGVLFEALRVLIQANDASGKLQITVPVRIALSTWIHVPLAPFPAPLPQTFPAFSGASYVLTASAPMPSWLPGDPPMASGPTATFGLINTDGAGAHTYIRQVACAYRYIYDIDYSKERVYVMGTLT